MSEKSREYGWADSETPQHHEYNLREATQWFDLFPAGSVVADLGCGNGALTSALSGRGWRLFGIDQSESGVRIARAQFPTAHFEVADLGEELNEHPLHGQCDLVLSFEVVEHIYLPRVFVRNAFRFLKPGGAMILSTPYNGYLKNVMLAILNRMDKHYTALWDHGHIKFWSAHTLGALLKEQGFQLERFAGSGNGVRALPGLWASMVVLAKRP